MREFLTRRIGPLPLWMWFVVVVLVAVVVLKWRQSHNGGSDSSSIAADSPNLTSQPSTLVPYTSDIFVNVQQPAASPSTPAGQPPQATPLPPPVPVPHPPARRTSITYPVKAGDSLIKIAKQHKTTTAALYAANKATIEAMARQHGFSSSGGGHWIFPGEKLVIPT